MKTGVVESLDVQLSESRQRFTGSRDDVSKLKEKIRELTQELTTFRAKCDGLQHTVSVTTIFVCLSCLVDTADNTRLPCLVGFGGCRKMSNSTIPICGGLMQLVVTLVRSTKLLYVGPGLYLDG